MRSGIGDGFSKPCATIWAEPICTAPIRSIVRKRVISFMTHTPRFMDAFKKLGCMSGSARTHDRVRFPRPCLLNRPVQGAAGGGVQLHASGRRLARLSIEQNEL